jgi:hypothetical protein
VTSTLPTGSEEAELRISTALSKAQPNSLRELFSRDPFGLVLTDFEARIDEMRRVRECLVEADLECQRLAEAKAEAKKARRKRSAAAITEATLAELGL